MSNGNTLQPVMETSPADTGRGTQAVKIDEAGRVKKRLKCWKSIVTVDVSACIKKLQYFKSQYEKDLALTGVQIDHANEILATHSRAKTRFKTLESNIEDLKMLYCDSWEATEDELDKVVEKLTTDLAIYKKKLTDIAKDYDKVLELCKCIALKSQPKAPDSRTRNTTTAPIAPSNNCFKPQTDLQPFFLAKDCTLLEYNTF